MQKTYISLDAIFDEDFTMPISIPDIPFQGALKLRDIKGISSMKNKGGYNTRWSQEENTPENMTNEDSMIVHAYFARMPKMKESDMDYAKYLHAAHDLRSKKKNEEKCQDVVIHSSDFIPEPKSLSIILRMSKHIQEKLVEAIRNEIYGHYL